MRFPTSDNALDAGGESGLAGCRTAALSFRTTAPVIAAKHVRPQFDHRTLLVANRAESAILPFRWYGRDTSVLN